MLVKWMLAVYASQMLSCLLYLFMHFFFSIVYVIQKYAHISQKSFLYTNYHFNDLYSYFLFIYLLKIFAITLLLYRPKQ